MNVLSRSRCSRRSAHIGCRTAGRAAIALGAILCLVSCSQSGRDLGPARGEAELHPFFPWPPSQPTTFTLSCPPYVRGYTSPSLKQIGTKLEERLRERDYSDVKFFSVPPSGFAAVTPLEKIDDGGAPVTDRQRWSHNSLKVVSVRGYLEALIFGRQGNFQSFVFIITNQDIQFSQADLNYQVAQEWLRRGGTSLPAYLDKISFSSEHKCYVLVYHFRKHEGEDPVFLRVPKWTAGEHLQNAGLWRGSAW